MLSKILNYFTSIYIFSFGIFLGIFFLSREEITAWESIFFIYSKILTFDPTTIISIAALIGTVCQAWAARTQNIRSIQPCLLISADWIRAENKYNITINNIGNGPAIYKNFEIIYMGATWRGDQLTKLFDSLVKNAEVSAGIFSHSSFYPHGGIAAGGSDTIFSVDVSDISLVENLNNQIKKARIIIRYASLLGIEDFYDSDSHTY